MTLPINKLENIINEDNHKEIDDYLLKNPEKVKEIFSDIQSIVKIREIESFLNRLDSLPVLSFSKNKNDFFFNEKNFFELVSIPALRSNHTPNKAKHAIKTPIGIIEKKNNAFIFKLNNQLEFISVVTQTKVLFEYTHTIPHEIELPFNSFVFNYRFAYEPQKTTYQFSFILEK